MKNSITYLIFSSLVIALLPSIVFSQTTWIVPDKESDKISIQTFNDDMVNEGRMTYENSCLSCHGTPTQEDFTLMVPSPGDPATELFQDQTDGSLFYKIQNGRDLMPGFKKAFQEDEIWNLVAFIRSFNPNYKQPLPDLTGIEIPELAISLGFDDNIDKLVVKVTANNKLEKSIEVSAFIKTMFGKYSLGNEITNEYGIAYFDVDSKLPGDSLGNLITEVKAKKGYGFAKITESLQIATPTIKKSAIQPNQLWSPDKDAPLWLDIIFHTTIILFWGIIIVIIFNLRKIKLVK